MQLSFRSFAGLHANAKASAVPHTRHCNRRVNRPHALTPEEEAFYEARLQEKKTQRKAAIQESKRRAQWDPSTGKGPAPEDGASPGPLKGGSRLSPEQELMRQQLVLRQQAQRATVASMAADSQATSKPAPSAPSEKSAAAPAPPTRPAPAKRPVPAATTSAPEAVIRPPPREMVAGGSDDDAVDVLVDSADDDEMAELSKLVDQLMKEEEMGELSVPVAEVESGSLVKPAAAAARRRRPVAAPGSYRPGTASSGKINLSRSPRPSVTRGGDSSPVDVGSQVQAPASKPAARTASPAPSASTSPVPNFDLPAAAAGDDLDWEALEAFESYEKYTDQLEVEESKAKAWAERGGKERAGSMPQASTSAASPAALSSGQGSKKDAGVAPVAKGGPAGAKMDAVDELEQLVKFFELVEKTEGAKGAAGAAGPSAGSASKSELLEMEAGIDWGIIERLMLGDELEKQMAGLKVTMAKQAGIDPKMLEEEYEPEPEDEGEEAAGGAGVDEGEPWNDEVSSMLVSLVLMSHRRYLTAPLFPVDLPEHARAAAVWASDIPIIVQDDSEELALEYGNKKALEMLGWSFEDVFEKTSLDLIDADPIHQQDWIFSTTEVYNSFERYTVMPEVRLRGANGKALSAKDVLVYRIDSLDGGPIGQAIIFRGPVVPV